MTNRNNRTRRLPVLLVALVVLAGCRLGFAEDRDIEHLRTAAEQGDAEAQYKLASVYAKGNGVSRDDVRSVHWMRKAAENGHAEAQDKVGGLYDNISTYERDPDLFKDDEFDKRLLRLSRGTPEGNGREAVRWYRKAAEQGHAEAQFALALTYRYGLRGTAINGSEAKRWYLKIAERDPGLGYSSIGYMYADGAGVPQNGREAVRWLHKGALQGGETGQFLLGLHYAKGETVPQNDVQAYARMALAASQGDKTAVEWRDALRRKMSAEQVAEAQKLAADLFNRMESAKSK